MHVLSSLVIIQDRFLGELGDVSIELFPPKKSHKDFFPWVETRWHHPTSKVCPKDTVTLPGECPFPKTPFSVFIVIKGVIAQNSRPHSLGAVALLGELGASVFPPGFPLALTFLPELSGSGTQDKVTSQG